MRHREQLVTKFFRPLLCSTAILLASHAPQQANAQGAYRGGVGFKSEDTFKEVFYTAGYSAAFGAALGAALLPFFPNPSLSSLRYIAGGASIGFILGSGFAFAEMARREPGFRQSDSIEEEYPYEQDTYSSLKDQSLPSGAIIVGKGQRLGFSLPVPQPLLSFSQKNNNVSLKGASIPLAELQF